MSQRTLFPDVVIAVGAISVIAVVIPSAIAKFLVGASWMQIGTAYALWVGGVWLMTGGPFRSLDQTLGWTTIMVMLVSWVVIPVLSLVLRLANVPERFMQ